MEDGTKAVFRLNDAGRPFGNLKDTLVLTATCDHPASSYGQPVWVDDDGEVYDALTLAFYDGPFSDGS